MHTRMHIHAQTLIRTHMHTHAHTHLSGPAARCHEGSGAVRGCASYSRHPRQVAQAAAAVPVHARGHMRACVGSQVHVREYVGWMNGCAYVCVHRKAHT